MSTSSDVKSAIINSLDEEKSLAWRPWVFGVLGALLAYTFLGEFLAWVLFSVPGLEWRLVSLFWASVFGLSCVVYFRPQARLQVRAFWTPWVFAAMILIAVVSFGLQVLVCPHFLFFETRLADFFGVFEAIRHFYMHIGGLAGCLFLCGVTFGVLCSLASFWVIRRTLSLHSMKPLLMAGGLLVLLATPLAFVPRVSAEHPFIFGYWWAGLVLSVFACLLSFAWARDRMTLKRQAK